MQPVILSDVDYMFFVSNNSITTHKIIKVISKQGMAPRD